MARRVVNSERTGETFVFDDDWNEPDGRVRQLEYTLAPKKRVPPHAHPETAQVFEVLAGELTIRVGREAARTLTPGERASTAQGQSHSQWNEGTEVARAMERYEPPLAIEALFTAIPQAIESSNPFKIAVLLADFGRVSRVDNLGMRIFIGAFAPLGRLFGFGGWYEPLLKNAGLL